MSEEDEGMEETSPDYESINQVPESEELDYSEINDVGCTENEDIKGINNSTENENDDIDGILDGDVTVTEYYEENDSSPEASGESFLGEILSELELKRRAIE